jgi:hypothetical protein
MQSILVIVFLEHLFDTFHVRSSSRSKFFILISWCETEKEEVETFYSLNIHMKLCGSFDSLGDENLGFTRFSQFKKSFLQLEVLGFRFEDNFCQFCGFWGFS